MQQSTEVIQLATLAAVQRSTGICGWADTPLSKPVIQRVAITSGVTRGRCIERARIMATLRHYLRQCVLPAVANKRSRRAAHPRARLSRRGKQYASQQRRRHSNGERIALRG
ncbi:TPA: hypothetical protein ACGQSM_003796 [Serratia liquefaciens]